jgi:hypothetical protein
MTMHVFVGPTLSVERARQTLPDATFLPPVSQGDVIRSASRRPSAIGIIDGRFHDVPAVWHKEILWALSRGVRVYGSASMGALRAAELAPFGMRGVGKIFQAYHSGELNDDDEVAVAHADAENDYHPNNEAMVSMRETLRLAAGQKVVSEATAARLQRLAKQTYYPARTYAQLMVDAQEAGLPADELAALRAWLPRNRVDQKALDAQEMLRLMARDSDAGPDAVSYTFEQTTFFLHARQTAGELIQAASGTESAPSAVNTTELLDELRLDPRRYRDVWERAALRALVDDASVTTGADLSRAAVQFRRARGLTGTAQTRAWLRSNDLTVEQFGALVAIEQRVERAIGECADVMPSAVLDLLRVDGEYEPLMRKVVAKRELLAAHGLDRPLGAEDDELAAQHLRWYFDVIGEPVPEPLENHWRALGFIDQRGFLRAIRRENQYRSLAE